MIALAPAFAVALLLAAGAVLILPIYLANRQPAERLTVGQAWANRHGLIFPTYDYEFVADDAAHPRRGGKVEIFDAKTGTVVYRSRYFGEMDASHHELMRRRLASIEGRAYVAAGPCATVLKVF